MIGISLDIPEVAARGGHIIAPAFVSVASGQSASFFADFTTEGGTNQYWGNNTQSAGLAAWIASMGGSTARASSANFFQSGLMVTAGSGVMRFPTTSGGSPTGLRITPAQTELLLFNRDLTNAAWTPTTMTVAKDQVGIDGAASAASSLTATAGNATILQSITRGSAARITGCWVKRITGSGAIQMTQDNGTTWTAITVTGSYTQIPPVIPTQTTANPVVGFRIVTNGDAIAVDCVAHREQGSGPAGIPDPIATTTVSVAQAGDLITFPCAIGTTAAVLAYAQNVVHPTATRSLLGGDTSSTAIFLGTFSSNTFMMYNGGSLIGQTGTSTLANLNKVMMTGTTGSRKLVVNNGVAATSATNLQGSSMTTATLGGYLGATTNNMAGDLGRIAIWPNLFASDADLATLTT